jgi:hypothetical protein
MTHHKWSKRKPKFTEECIMLSASKYKGEWDYHSWLILKVDGEDENGKLGWYWGLHDIDGQEWGAWEDHVAEKYMTLPLLK